VGTDGNLRAEKLRSSSVNWRGPHQRKRIEMPSQQLNIERGTGMLFNQPDTGLLNVVVSGYWPGNPDVTTVFPQRMYVDGLD